MSEGKPLEAQLGNMFGGGEQKPPENPLGNMFGGGEQKPPENPLGHMFGGGEQKPPENPLGNMFGGGDQKPPENSIVENNGVKNNGVKNNGVKNNGVKNNGVKNNGVKQTTAEVNVLFPLLIMFVISEGFWTSNLYGHKKTLRKIIKKNKLNKIEKIFIAFLITCSNIFVSFLLYWSGFDVYNVLISFGITTVVYFLSSFTRSPTILGNIFQIYY